MNVQKLESLGFVAAVRACNIHHSALSHGSSRSHKRLLELCSKVADRLFIKNQNGEKELYNQECDKPDNIFKKGIFK